jgi:hypothetical protein
VLDDVVLSNLTRQGIFEGEVAFDAGLQQLARADGGSFLADGFLEGQLVRVVNDANPAQFVDLKIAIIRGDNATFDNRLEFTTETDLTTPRLVDGFAR